LVAVDIAVAGLEFRFEPDFKLGQVDEVPACDVLAVITSWSVLEANQQMNGVIAQFISRDLWFEVEGPETTVTTASSIEFRIEIEDPVRSGLD
jgi:hypothetical protein